MSDSFTLSFVKETADKKRGRQIIRDDYRKASRKAASRTGPADLVFHYMVEHVDGVELRFAIGSEYAG